MVSTPARPAFEPVALDALLSSPGQPLAPGETALWFALLPDDAPAPQRLEQLLDADERARAARFVREADRQRFVLGHGALRAVLAFHTGLEASRLVFVHSAHGKPGLDGGPHCNLSHAGGCVAIAVRQDAPVGVDVEPLRTMSDVPALLAQVCAPEEREAMSRWPGHRLSEAFLTLWTRKEAYVKALGLGLSAPLDAFAVSLGGSPRVLRHWDGAQAAPELHGVPAPEGFLAALALLPTHGAPFPVPHVRARLLTL